MINKIQKLLALSEGTHSQNEAHSAMMKVQELLLSNNLTMFDVQSYTETEEKNVAHIHTDITRARMPWWWKTIANVVAKNMKCFVYTSNNYDYDVHENVKTITLIGLDSDVEAATLTIKFAIRSADSCYNAFKKNSGPAYNRFRGKNIGSGMKNDYLRGFIAGLKQNFTNQVSTKALVLVKDALVIQEFAKLKPRKSITSKINRNGNNAAYGQGFSDGKGSKRDAYIT